MARNFNKIIIIFYLIAIPLGCGSKTSSKLKIEILPDSKSYIVPSKAMDCKSELLSASSSSGSTGSSTYVTGPRADFIQIKITWSGTSDLYLSSTKFVFSSSQIGGDYTCLIEDDEFNALFKGTTNPKWNGSYIAKAADEANPSVLLSNPACRIRCGGLKIAADATDKRFLVTGKLKILGSALDSDGGKAVPISAEAKAVIENLP